MALPLKDQDTTGIKDMPSVTKLLNIKKKQVIEQIPSMTQASVPTLGGPLKEIKAADKDKISIELWKLHSGKQVNRALFLRSTTQNGFSSESALASESWRSFWSSLAWPSDLAQDLHAGLIKNGFLDVAPDASPLLGSPTRNALRSAFGADNEEFLFFVRVGAADRPTGVVALFSSVDLRDRVQKIAQALS